MTEAAGRIDPLELLTLAEASRLTKRSISTLNRDRRAGRLRVVHLGRSTRIPRVELERYIAAGAEGATLGDVHSIDERKS